MNWSQIFLICFGSVAGFVLLVLWWQAAVASNEYNRGRGGW